jgi:predicted nucleic-acid-binding protein
LLAKQKLKIKNLLTDSYESGSMTISTIKSVLTDSIEALKNDVSTSSLSIDYVARELMHTVLTTLKNLGAMSKENVYVALSSIILAAKRIDKDGNKITLTASIKIVLKEVEHIFTDFGTESLDLFYQIKKTITLDSFQRLNHTKKMVQNEISKIVDTSNMDKKFYTYIYTLMSNELKKEALTPKRLLHISSVVLYGAIEVSFKTRDLAQNILENTINAIIDASDQSIENYFSTLNIDDLKKARTNFEDLNNIFAQVLKNGIKKTKDNSSKYILEELAFAHGKANFKKPIKKSIKKEIEDNRNIILKGSAAVLSGMFKPMKIVATPITKLSKPAIDKMEEVGEKMIDKIKIKMKKRFK